MVVVVCVKVVVLVVIVFGKFVVSSVDPDVEE